MTHKLAFSSERQLGATASELSYRFKQWCRDFEMGSWSEGSGGGWGEGRGAWGVRRGVWGRLSQRKVRLR